MKRITFGAAIQLKEYTRADVVSLLNEFLRRNGVFTARDIGGNGITNSLIIKWNCANNDYTRAFGLLFLLFSNNPYAYIELRPDECRINMTNGKYTELYNYINKRMDVTIEL